MRRPIIIVSVVLVAAAAAVLAYFTYGPREPKGGGFPPPPVARFAPYDTKTSRVLEETLSRMSPRYEYRTDWEPKSYLLDRKARQKAAKKKVKEPKNIVKLYPFPVAEEYEEPSLVKNAVDLSNIPPAKEWEHTGVKGIGVVNSVAVAAKNVKHILIGTEGSGLYRSTDFGVSWKKLDFPRNDVRNVFIDPKDPKHYVVFGAKAYYASVEPRLYESFDTGNTWSAGSPPPGQHEVTDLKLTPKGVLVVAENKAFGNSFDIMQRIDAAGNIYTLRKTVAAQEALRLKVKPTGFGLAGFQVKQGVGATAKIFYRIYLTSDHGETWTANPVFTTANFPDYAGFITAAYDISPDGKRLAVALEDPESKKACAIAHSLDGGQNWEFTEIEEYTFEAFGDVLDNKTEAEDNLRAQDIVLDAENENYIAVFRYMRGLYESTDGGESFFKTVDKAQDIAFLETVEGLTRVVDAFDLRMDNMAAFDFGGAINFLLPTDQGLFMYRNLQGAEHSFANLAPGLYLGDSGKVAVTSCPRVYTGLWHVGSYWINPDGSVEGFIGGENWGYGTGEDEACETPVFSAVHGYLSDGRNVNAGKTGWFQDALDLGWPIAQVFQYMDGWWYAWADEAVPTGVAGATEKLRKLLRIDDDFSTFEYLSPLGNDKTGRLKTFALAEADGRIWYLDVTKRLWSKSGEDDWALVKDLLTAGLGPVNPAVNGALGMLAGEDRLVIHGLGGVITSEDGGNTWQKGLVGRKVQAMAGDRCGMLYAAVEPEPHKGVGGGVYRSSAGKSFSKLGKGDEKSYIHGLAVDHVNDVLYAATLGESLMRVALEPCGN